MRTSQRMYDLVVSGPQVSCVVGKRIETFELFFDKLLCLDFTDGFCWDVVLGDRGVASLLYDSLGSSEIDNACLTRIASSYYLVFAGQEKTRRLIFRLRLENGGAWVERI